MESVREACSCGAQIRLKGITDPMAHVRQWRKSHHCLISEQIESREVTLTAQVEQPLGFRADGVEAPVRREHIDW